MMGQLAGFDEKGGIVEIEWQHPEGEPIRVRYEDKEQFAESVEIQTQRLAERARAAQQRSFKSSERKWERER